MSYGTFVKELNKGNEGCVIAYDNRKNHEGCLLHLRKRPLTIFVPAAIIDHHWAEALSALKVSLRELDQQDEHLVLAIDESGNLGLQPASTPELGEPARIHVIQTADTRIQKYLGSSQIQAYRHIGESTPQRLA